MINYYFAQTTNEVVKCITVDRNELVPNLFAVSFKMAATRRWQEMRLSPSSINIIENLTRPLSTVKKIKHDFHYKCLTFILIFSNWNDNNLVQCLLSECFITLNIIINAKVFLLVNFQWSWIFRRNRQLKWHCNLKWFYTYRDSQCVYYKSYIITNIPTLKWLYNSHHIARQLDTSINEQDIAMFPLAMIRLRCNCYANTCAVILHCLFVRRVGPSGLLINGIYIRPRRQRRADSLQASLTIDRSVRSSVRPRVY